MKTLPRSLLLLAAPVVLFGTPLAAQQVEFSWEGELEIGIDEVYSSDDPTAEFRDIYPILNLSGELAFANGISLFAGVVAEPVVDAADDREFDDLGVYLEELGLRYAAGPAVFTVGKFSPTFGVAWDATAGFYGAFLAEDYELLEKIGVAADVSLGDTGGVLSFALFYDDDTALSRSIGFDRGRNVAEFGGAGNTGELNNATLTWTQTFGDSTDVQLGVRHLSGSTGDVSDDTGIVASVSHVFGNGLGVFGEVASFDGYEGSGNDATYVTLNAVYGIGPWSLSATLARRDVDTVGTTDLASIAAEYEFDNGVILGAALAQIDEAGVKSDALGFNIIIPLGG